MMNEMNEKTEKELRRDSISRINNDLIEVILSYLSFEEKIKFESISKQWKQLLFNKQTVLQIEDRKNGFNSLNQMLSEERIDLKVLKSVLKKCQFINQIVFNFSGIDDKVIDLITNECQHLKQIHFNRDLDLTISQHVFIKFGEKFGHNLVKISMSSLNSNQEMSNHLMKRFLKLCPKVKEIQFKQMKAFIDEDKEFLPKLESITCNIDINDGKLLSMIASKYKNQMKKIDLFIDNSSSSGECVGWVDVMTIRSNPHFNCNINSFIPQFNELSQNCPEMLELRLTSWKTDLTGELLESMTRFGNLKTFSFSTAKRDVKFAQKCFGELESCQMLSDLRFQGFKMTDQLFNGFHKFAPNLKKFVFLSDSQFSDQLMYCLAKLSKLSDICLSTFFSVTFEKITDSGVYHLINWCQSLNYLDFICFTKINDKTIDLIIERAVNNPKIEYYFRLGYKSSEVNNIVIVSKDHNKDEALESLPFDSNKMKDLPKNLKFEFNPRKTDECVIQ